MYSPSATLMDNAGVEANQNCGVPSVYTSAPSSTSSAQVVAKIQHEFSIALVANLSSERHMLTASDCHHHQRHRNHQHHRHPRLLSRPADNHFLFAHCTVESHYILVQTDFLHMLKD